MTHRVLITAAATFAAALGAFGLLARGGGSDRRPAGPSRAALPSLPPPSGISQALRKMSSPREAEERMPTFQPHPVRHRSNKLTA